MDNETRTPPLPDRELPFRGVLFDAVGTVLYPEPAVDRAYEQAGRKHGLSKARHEIRTRFEAAFARCFQRVETDESAERRAWFELVASVFDVAAARAEPVFDELWNHFADPRHWRLYSDVAFTWERLRRNGLRLGVASNFDQRLLGICQGLPPLDSAAHVFCSSRVGYCKPEPAFFETIQTELELSPGELLFVGDDPQRDVQGAQSAGWHAILVDRDGKYPELSSIASLSELEIG